MYNINVETTNKCITHRWSWLSDDCSLQRKTSAHQPPTMFDIKHNEFYTKLQTHCSKIPPEELHM